MRPREFLPEEQHKRVTRAIEEAERLTSGEICVHIESDCPAGDPVERAIEHFNRHELWRTMQRNAVLIYIATNSRVLAIIGDTGINNRVPSGFWDDIRAELIARVAAGEQADGLCAAIHSIGKRLATYFPPMANDINELSNEVIYED